MKRYSDSRFAIEYVLIGFSTYLLLSLVIALIGGYSYREVLNSGNQVIGLFFIYPWVPIPRMMDMDRHNKKIDEL